MWRATGFFVALLAVLDISIHALRVEGDNVLGIFLGEKSVFLSTPSVWRATYIKRLYRWCDKFLSTPSVWRATERVEQVGFCHVISIHALRVEGDRCEEVTTMPRTISIHALRVEGDPGRDCPPARQAISIHALRVEGDLYTRDENDPLRISIHALRVEGDGQSEDDFNAKLAISIHALRVEGDPVPGVPQQGASGISIHALRVEGDLIQQQKTLASELFLSTPSVWRATAVAYKIQAMTQNFYPRPPCGGRRGRFRGYHRKH